MTTVAETAARAANRRARLPRILQATVLGILAAAAAVATVQFIVVGAGWVAYLGPALALGGAVVALRHAYLGFSLVALAPVAVAVSAEVPEAAWSMVCVAAFLLAFRGMPVLVVGPVLGVLNFVSSAIVSGVGDSADIAITSVFAFAALLGAAAASAVRSNLRYRDAVEQRIRDAEEIRHASVDRGVAQERLRIARDLHDSVGHQIAVVNMRLGAAEVHLPEGAERSRAELAAARDSVQAVLRETQQILSVLRVGAEPRDGGGRRPISDLVDAFHDAGMLVDAEFDDVHDMLSPQADIAAYRIVQEALTNAQRYGQGRASVTVRRDGDDVRIDVVNSRADPLPAGGGGNGLVGMRERAASVGGTLDARVDGGLFWVTARLPVTMKETR